MSPSMFNDKQSTVQLNESSIFQPLDSKEQPIVVHKSAIATANLKG